MRVDGDGDGPEADGHGPVHLVVADADEVQPAELTLLGAAGDQDELEPRGHRHRRRLDAQGDGVAQHGHGRRVDHRKGIAPGARHVDERLSCRRDGAEGHHEQSQQEPVEQAGACLRMSRPRLHVVPLL